MIGTMFMTGALVSVIKYMKLLRSVQLLIGRYFRKCFTAIIFSFTMPTMFLVGCGEEESTDVSSLFESIEVPLVIEEPEPEPEPEPEFVDPIERCDYTEVGIRREAIKMIETIIETDIENGFTSAQLAIIRHNKLVYENAWGYDNSYNQDGSRKEDGVLTTTDTLYDLASVSKMFGVNYALQKMVTDGELSVDERIVDILGPEFAENTIDIKYKKGVNVDLETMKRWKSELTVAELLKHQGGFPADPRYCNPHVDQASQEYDPSFTNVLYSGCGADEATKEATREAIFKTPLLYEPGTNTVYSDVDYMILGLVVEKKSGMDLDTYIKKTFCEPMGLTHVTYNPLQNGFQKDDCAATELNGNTRDGYISFDGIRTYTLQGEVHDEKAYYCMGGVSGHAGLFSNAGDIARLGTLMLSGKYGDMEFFSREVIDTFTARKSANVANWGLRWWRQGNTQRAKYFGTKAGSETIGHQGWTGTLVMIDPEKDMVIVILTNKINSPVTNKNSNPNKFDGNWFTTANLGFVAETLYIGLDTEDDITGELDEYSQQLVEESKKSIKRSMGDDHPASRNYLSKKQVRVKMGFEEES